MVCQQTQYTDTDRDQALVTQADHDRILRMLDRLTAAGHRRSDEISVMQECLADAQVVSPFDVPRNVITLNSRVRLCDVETGRRTTLTLVSPFETSLFGDQLSVVGPAGASLLGRRVGQIVTWTIGPKIRRYRIEEILYQPESAGDFHL